MTRLARVRDLFAKEDYQGALALIDQCYTGSNNQSVHVIKAILLCRLDQFKKCIQLLKRHRLLHDHRLVFEHAYCLYRLGLLSRCLTTIKSVSNPSRKLSLLHAQLLYRMELYNDSARLYQSLYDEEPDERLALNLLAVKAAASFANKPLSSNHLSRSATTSATDPNAAAIHVAINVNVDPEHYETGYNLACGLLGNDDFASAEPMLKKALSTETYTLKTHNYSPSEIDTELASLIVQLGYTYQQLGHDMLARDYYDRLLSIPQLDKTLRAIVVNNAAITHRRLALADFIAQHHPGHSVIFDDLKVPTYQKTGLQLNSIILGLCSEQTKQARTMCRKLLKEDLTNEIREHVRRLLASSYMQETNKGRCRRGIEMLGDADVISRDIYRIECDMMAGKYSKCLSALERLYAKTKAVAVLTLQIATLARQGQYTRALELLRTAQQQGFSTPKAKAAALLCQACLGYYADAPSRDIGDALEALRQIDLPQDSSLKTAAGIVELAYKVDNQHQTMTSDCQFEDEEIGDIDLSSTIEEIDGYFGQKREHKSAGRQIDTKKPRKKRPIVASTIDHDRKPDPERWIPLKERSYYRRGKKRGTGKK